MGLPLTPDPKGKRMAHSIEVSLPEEMLKTFEREDLSAKAKEALVMTLVREHRISQGKAAELLGVSRYQLADLMAKHHVPAFDCSDDELAREVRAANRLTSQVKRRRKKPARR